MTGAVVQVDGAADLLAEQYTRVDRRLCDLSQPQLLAQYMGGARMQPPPLQAPALSSLADMGTAQVQQHVPPSAIWHLHCVQLALVHAFSAANEIPHAVRMADAFEWFVMSVTASSAEGVRI